MSWIVVFYFTDNEPYPKHAKHLIESVQSFGLPYDATPVKTVGSWDANTHYKPIFLKQMLEKFYPQSLVYVDCDAVFCKYPAYFDYLDNWKDGPDIAVHVLDHSKYTRKNHAPELLSGTIFLRNTPTISIIVGRWLEICQKNPTMWDQRALAHVLQDFPYHVLPEEYCVIFDYMQSVKNPVIKHFQASREARRAKKHSPVTNQVHVVKRRPKQNQPKLNPEQSYLRAWKISQEPPK